MPNPNAWQHLALIFFRCAAAASISISTALAPAVAQSTSTLGMNLSGGQEEMPFLNVLKLAGGWYTESSSNVDTGEETTLYSTFVDGNHYPTSLTAGHNCPGGPCPSHTFTQVSAYPLLQSNGSTTPVSFSSGTYVLLFTGAQNTATAGTISVTALSGSVGTTCPSTGRCLITGFNESANVRLRVTIKTTDPSSVGNYINNIALIYAPDSTSFVVGVNEAAFTGANCLTAVSGPCFNPTWLSLMMPFRTLRMMDWSQTLTNLNKNWSDRSLVSWAFWNEDTINDTTTGNRNGVPVEVQIAACNTLGANCWLNVPCEASASYVQSEASLVGSLLGSSLKVYAEYCNEVWNSGALLTAIQNYMVAAGETAYPNTSSGQCPGTPFSSFSYLFAYGILQQVLDTNIFYNMLGSSRVVRVLAGQASYTARNQFILGWQAGNCGGNAALFSGTAAQNADALATAPYFGNTVPLAWTANSDGGLRNFFIEQNSGGILPSTVVTGNCGNGLGQTCGGPGAFSITTGLSLPNTPTNGTCIGMKFATANATSATLSADGGTAFPLVNSLGTPLAAGAMAASATTAFCFTNQTSAGSVSAAWYEQPLGYKGISGNGWLAQAIDDWNGDLSVASAYDVNLVAYESGQSYVAGNNTAYENLYYTTMRDGCMGAAYSAYYNSLSAGGTGIINVFSDIGNFSQYGTWGVLEDILDTTSPRYAAVQTLSSAAAYTCPYSLKNAHDLNADGMSDIAWRDGSGNLAIWEMNGGTILNPSTSGLGTVPAPWAIVGQRDFNGDGYADILWRNTSTGDLAIWEMNGTTILNPSNSGLGSVPVAWSIVGTGDFNGDGYADILWRNTSTGDLAIWEMNGTTILNPSTTGLGNVPLNWTVVGVGDFNGDGKADILWRNTNGNVAIWEMNGTTISSSATFGNMPTSWFVAGTGDFNGDGNSDILWQDSSGDIAIWEMNGTTILNPSTSGVGNLSTVWSVAETGDFNGTGKSDILWRDTSGDVAIWFMNGTTISSGTGLGAIPTTFAIQDTNAD